MRNMAIHTRFLPAVLAGALLLVDAAPGAAAEPEQKNEASLAERERKLEEARARLDAAAREVADLSMSLSDDAMPRIMGFVGRRGQRATLGVVIGSQRNADRDDGVEILSVSPGGAAEEAGLKAGDVLTEIDGKALKRDDQDSPRAKLLNVMRDVDPGDKVTVKYRRADKVSTASVVTKEPEDRLFNAPFAQRGWVERFDGFPGSAFMRAEGVFGTAELVPLTAKLGQYFGAEKGLLVVRAPADSRLQLEEGDVILDIDGRVPSSPGHALRILGSYQAGEKLKLNVLRMKKRMTFDITIPDDRHERGMRRSGFMEYPALEAAPAIPFNMPAPAPAITIAVPGDEPV
jgi:C-terminal processing protease CtpA/Prc